MLPSVVHLPKVPCSQQDLTNHFDDNCANTEDLTVNVEFKDFDLGDDCQWIVSLEYSATDPCGNTAACVQNIQVEDTMAPVLDHTNIGDQSLTCESNVDPQATGEPTASDECASINEIIIAYSDESTQGTEGCADHRPLSQQS